MVECHFSQYRVVKIGNLLGEEVDYKMAFKFGLTCRRFITTFLATVTLIVLISGMGILGVLPVSSAPAEKPLIIATTAVLGDLAEQIGKDQIDVYMIVPSGMCPAHYDVRPSDIMAIRKASLIIQHGVEPWLDGLIKAAEDTKAKRIRLKGPWNVPEGGIEKIKGIAQALVEISPQNGDYFRKNAESLQADVEKLAQELKQAAENAKVGETNVITMEWQREFVEWLGFHVVATYPPPERISMKQAAELMTKGKEVGVAMVIDNLQSGTDFGARLAYELGAVHVVLTNFPGALPGTKGYLQMLSYNANQLLNAKKIYQGAKR